MLLRAYLLLSLLLLGNVACIGAYQTISAHVQQIQSDRERGYSLLDLVPVFRSGGGSDEAVFKDDRDFLNELNADVKATVPVFPQEEPYWLTEGEARVMSRLHTAETLTGENTPEARENQRVVLEEMMNDFADTAAYDELHNEVGVTPPNHYAPGRSVEEIGAEYFSQVQQGLVEMETRALKLVLLQTASAVYISVDAARKIESVDAGANTDFYAYNLAKTLDLRRAIIDELIKRGEWEE